jgi:hypothetical protein
MAGASARHDPASRLTYSVALFKLSSWGVVERVSARAILR